MGEGTKSFEVVLTRELEVLAKLKGGGEGGGLKVSTLKRGLGAKSFTILKMYIIFYRIVFTKITTVRKYKKFTHVHEIDCSKDRNSI